MTPRIVVQRVIPQWPGLVAAVEDIDQIELLDGQRATIAVTG
jgi:hypothetical protein